MLGIPFLDSVLFKLFSAQVFDDPIDRLNYLYTASILTFFAIMVSAKQYVGSPIQCWMPMEFKGGWEQYAEDYCFIQNTFFVPFHEEIPGDTDAREQREIGYYQWVPITLALQAIAFYLPNWLWNVIQKQSGLDMLTVVSEAQKLRSLGAESRRQEIHKLVNYISECLEFKRSNKRSRLFCFQFGTSLGSSLAMSYISIKFFYLTNIILQFYLMNEFLGNNHVAWGIETLLDLFHGREWMESGVFPRVTLCDFKVRRLANIHRYTVQCVLMINMFNEKIYLFLWFWFLFVAVGTLVNFTYTLALFVFSTQREKTVTKLISIRSTDADQTDSYSSRRGIRSFTQRGLRADGVLLLRFIDGHAGALVAREIAQALFEEYLEQSGAYNMPIAGHSTKSTSPGVEEGPHESLYHPEKLGGLMAPDYPIKRA